MYCMNHFIFSNLVQIPTDTEKTIGYHLFDKIKEKRNYINIQTCARLDV